MAINVYCGLMGSGKSYEAISSVVIPAIKVGRRVVTNIYGMNELLIHRYISDKFNVPIDQLGSIVLIEDEAIKRAGFFYDPSSQDSIVQPGDLIVVDESWRHWGQGAKITDEHMQFFRMHRHYTHPETGVSCDVALMVQSINDLHRMIRNVVALTCKMTKLKRLGLNSSYRVEVYDGSRCTESNKTTYFIKKYDPEIFPLYNSYSGSTNSNGVERSIDRRENVLLNPRYIIIFVIAITVLIASPYLLYKKFKKLTTTSENEPVADLSLPQSTTSNVVVTTSKQELSKTLRLSGEIIISGRSWVVLTDAEGRCRLENPAAFVGEGISRLGHIDGETIATWTGPSSSLSHKKGLFP